MAEAGDGAEAVALARAHEPDLAILDIAMPRLTGLQAARELSRLAPDLRILILTMYDNEQYFFEALKAGASGYVLKSVADRDLVEACRAAMRDEPFLYPGAVTALIRDYLDRVRHGDDLPARAITEREEEILKLVAEGHSSKEIAEILVHQRQDGRAAPGQPAAEARPQGPAGADPLRDPRRADRAVSRRPELDHRTPNSSGYIALSWLFTRVPPGAGLVKLPRWSSPRALGTG